MELRPLRALTLLVPAALLALPLTGCEIALIVAAAAGDDETTQPYAPYYDNYCNEFVDANHSLDGEEGNAELASSTFNGITGATPGTLLASNDMFPFFLSTEADPGVDFRVETTGSLTRQDESVGGCTSTTGTAGSFLEIESGAAGKGSLVVFVDDDEYDRFDFEVADVTGFTIEWDTTLGAARAKLTDDEGRSVYAFNSVTWEAAPTTFFTAAAGPISPTITWDGFTSEVVLFAFYGDFSAQITLVANQATGVMFPKDE